MPIRMVDDPRDPDENSGDGGGSFGPGGGATQSNNQVLATGGYLDPRQFEKANIYESLSDDTTKNPLPEAANLQKFAPQVGDQGHQGSCVAWSSAYAARTIEEAARTGADPISLPFSPSFLYNQIGLDNCDGSYIERAMEFMTQSGSIPYQQFPYDDRDCAKQPDQQQLEEARQYRMRGFNRLTPGDDNKAIDLHAIEENISQGAPVVIGMQVGGSYMQPMLGKDLWEPTQEDRSMLGFGGHNGFAWVRYPDFSPFCGITGYRLFPKDKSMMPDSIGTRDVMAVVVSKQPLDWYGLNNTISANPGQDYGARIQAALGNNAVHHVVFKSSAKGNMQFTVQGDNDKSVVATIVEIAKK